MRISNFLRPSGSPLTQSRACVPKKATRGHSLPRTRPFSSQRSGRDWNRFYSSTFESQRLLPASSYNFNWFAATSVAAGALVFSLTQWNSVHAQETDEKAKEDAEYIRELAAIQALLESLMLSGISSTTLPDLASQLWVKIAARDASGLVTIFGSTTQLNKAIDKLLKMLDEGRERRELCKPLAVAYILRGLYEQAMPFLLEASWEYPSDPELHLHQGHIYMRESNYSMAYEHFEKALLLNPRLMAAEGPRNEMFKKLMLSPETALYWHVQGVIRFDLGMYQESVACYSRALEIDPTFQDSWYNSRVVQHILDRQAQYGEDGIDPIPARVLPIVTSYEYATLAEAAYTVSAKAVPPKDWKLWLTSGDFLDNDGSLSRDGFFGATYVNHEKKQIVLALQGSKATNDIVSCIHLVFNTVDRQWVCAKLFGEKVHQIIAADPLLSTYRVSLTGHSLGAAQAEYLSVLFKKPAVTFESPGIQELLSVLVPSPLAPIDPTSYNVTSYMPRPNIINTAKKHIGKLIRIYPPLPPKSIRADGSNLLMDTLNSIRKITDVVALPGIDRVVGSPFGIEVIKLLGETELMVLETAHWHSMERICQAFRHEYDTGIPIKQRTVVQWPQTENFYLFWRVARDSNGEPDEMELTELNRESLKFARYEVQDRDMNRVPLSEFSRSEQRFLREFRRNPAAFTSQCSELDNRVLSRYVVYYGHVDINVGLSPEHFRDYVKWKAAELSGATDQSAISFTPVF